MPCDDEEMKRQALSSGHPDTQLARYTPSDIERAIDKEVSKFFPGAIQLPCAMPEQPPLEANLQSHEPSVVELVTLDEQRREESKRRRAGIPFPDVIAERPPLTRYSMVGAIEVNSETLLGFLSALDFIAPRATSNTVLMSALASYDVDANAVPGSGELTLEATNGSMWAQVTMKARAERHESFRFSIPIGRAIAIMKLLRTQYRNVVIGMDRGEICIGPYSMPFAGLLDQFPPREAIMSGEARVALPAHYVRRIVECLSPVQTEEPQGFLGVHLDIAERVAVATDGERMHVLSLADLPVEQRNPRVPPPSVTVPPRFFDFLLAVANREWTAVELNEMQITAVGEDFAISTRVMTEKFADWKPALAAIPGVYLVDREALVSFFRQAALVHAAVELEVIPLANTLFMAAKGKGAETLKKAIQAQPDETAVSQGRFVVDARHVLQAAEMCLGGMLRLGLPRAGSEPVTIRGEASDFVAIIMTKEII